MDLRHKKWNEVESSGKGCIRLRFMEHLSSAVALIPVQLISRLGDDRLALVMGVVSEAGLCWGQMHWTCGDPWRVETR